MKANELRIGNYLKHKITLEILGEEPNDVFAVNHIMLRDCFHYGEDWAFEGIPLTEEWLVKFGFERTGYENLFLSNGKLDISGDPEQDIPFGLRINNSIDVYFEHVHTFQNFYYALIGEELTIKSLTGSQQ
jgi:hypothetical protein